MHITDRKPDYLNCTQSKSLKFSIILMRINLTYLITGTQYGGAGVGMVRVLSGIDKSKFDINVISLTESESGISTDLPEYVEYDSLSIDRKLGVHRLLPLVDILQDTDFLVCSAYHASVIGVPLARLLQVPEIGVWQHSTRYKSQVRKKVYRYIYQMADSVFPDSKATKRMLQEEHGISNSKMTVLPIAGVDTARFSPNQEPSNIDHERVVVGTVARLVEEKGLFDLIKCAELLGPEYQFKIIGNGNLYKEIENEAPENVELLGFMKGNELIENLASFDIYFQPSKHEGLCMTVIEAMSCELPVVASEVGGIPESVIPGMTGFLCDSGDIDCFVSHIRRLASDEELRQEMGNAGRKRVIERYSQSELISRFEQVVS